MKVLHVIEEFSENLGEIATATLELIESLYNKGFDTTLLTPLSKIPDNKYIGEGKSWVRGFKNDLVTPVGISKNAVNLLDKIPADIYHINGIWQFIDHYCALTARRKGKPYVITTHGMLYEEALKRSAWKKKLVKALWFNKDIEEASCIHVTCEKEMEQVRRFGYKGPIAVIGNPVKIPGFTTEILKIKKTKNRERLSIGFLGRLHPIKCIEKVLYAIALRGKDDVEFYIMGEGLPEYTSYLKQEIERLNLSRFVKFTGFLKGFDKYAQLGLIDCLFVPSDMENFGMIIPEALIVGTPVMASLGTPWKALNDEKCGWWADNSPESIAHIINTLTQMNSIELLEMGTRGRNYILKTFAADKIAAQMIQLYKWLCGEIDKPHFIYTV